MLKKVKRFNYTAVITLFVLLFNTIATIIPEKSHAYTATPNSKGHYVEIVSAYDSSDSSMVDDWNDENVLWFDIQITGNINVGGLDIRLKYDTSVLTPVYYQKKKGYKPAGEYLDWDIEDEDSNFALDSLNCSLDPSAGEIVLVTVAGEDINPNGGATSIIRMPFMLQDGTDKDALPTSLFTLNPGGTVPVSGYMIAIDGGSDSEDNVSYFGYGNGFVTAAKTIQSIAVTKNPTKMNYDHGDTINLTGGEITVTYTDSSTEIVSMTDAKVATTKPVSGKADVANSQVELTYNGKSTTFNINVTDPIVSITLNPGLSKVNYNEGETINYTGAAIKVTRKSGATSSQSVTTGIGAGKVTTDTTIASVAASNSVAGPNNEAGLPTATQTITLGYEGKTCTATVLVNDTVKTVAVQTQPTKTVYKYGESLNLAGGTLKVTTNAGNTLYPSLTDGTVTVSPFSSKTLGTQNLTASFAGVNATGTVNLTVQNYVASINVNAPTKTTYNYGDSLDLTGGTVDEVMADGSAGTTGIPLTNAAVTVTGYNPTMIGSQTLSVKYTKGSDIFNGFFNVTVNDAFDDIILTPPTKTSYNIGDTIDLTGGYIKEKMKSGTVSGTTIPLTTTGVTISPTTFTSNGSQTVTVLYKGKSKTFTVTVNDEGTITFKYQSFKGDTANSADKDPFAAAFQQSSST